MNILPTVLAQTTGLSGVLVFKVAAAAGVRARPGADLPALAALPRPRLALVAATFTIAFPTFFTDMPYLVRQEVAFFFLALMLLAATEPARRAWRLRRWSASSASASSCRTTRRPT